MLKKIFINTIFVLSLFLLIEGVSAVYAANLEFSPSSVSGTVNTNFDLELKVDSGGENILGVDVRMLYPSDLLELVTVEEEPPEAPPAASLIVGDIDTTEAGKIYINAVVLDPARAVSGVKTIATLTFKPKKNGSGTLTFVCVPGQRFSDSDIGKNDVHVTDIIVCSDNGEADITIGGGPTGTPRPTNTPRPTSSTEETPTPAESGFTPTEPAATTTPAVDGEVDTPTPTPTPPEPGNAINIIKFVAPGTILLLVGLGIRMLLL